MPFCLYHHRIVPFQMECDLAAAPQHRKDLGEDLKEDFRLYYQDNWERFRRLAYWKCRDSWTAEDLAQTTLENLLRRWEDEEIRHRAKNDSRFVSRCITNSWIDLLRKENADQRRIEKTKVTVEVPDAGYSDIEHRDHVSRLLGELDPTWRAVIVMRHFQDKSFADIAAALGGISERTARRYERRALMALGEAEQRM